MKTGPKPTRNGTFTLCRTLPDGDDKPWNDLEQLTIFQVYGNEVNVTLYENAELIYEREMDRQQARERYRELLSMGYRPGK